MSAEADPSVIEGGGGAVEFLLRRMQRSQDFPALSETIRSLNRLTAANEKSTEQLAAVIVGDFALTNKILKVVNSAYYAGFAGKVGTISRAIVVLGIEPIRSLAASLMLFEHLSEGSNAARVKALIGKSMFGALLAREIAVDAGLEHGEEAFLAAMFHNLGELLVAFYLPDEDQAVQHAIEDGASSPTQAQLMVLGVDFEHLGIAVGRHWNFPNAITHSMKKTTAGIPARALHEEERLRRLACFASELTECLAEGARADGPVVGALIQRYSDSITLETTRLGNVLQDARSEYRRLAESLAAPELAPAAIRALIGLQQDAATGAPGAEDFADVALPTDDAAAPNAHSGDPEPVLLEGLQEATAMLAEGAGVNQVAQVMLETLYRAFGLRRVALCLRDVAQRKYAGRLGFGDDVDEYLRALHFDEAYARDVFHVALKKQTDVHIADLAVGGSGHGIPAWYNALSPDGALLFLPLVVLDRPVGCILVEHSEPGGLDLEPGTLRLVRALRNQLVLGLQLRRSVRS